MKNTTCQFIFPFLFLLLFCCVAYAQSTGDYRSVASSSWNNVSTWQRFDGSSWVSATVAPSDTDGVITIRNLNTVNLTAPVTADQIMIESGGQFTVSNTLTLTDGPGIDLDCYGKLTIATHLNGNGSITVHAGQTIVWSGGNIQNNGTIMIESGAFFTIQSNNSKSLTQTRTIVNYGTINWMSGNFGLQNTSALENYGVFNINSNNVITTGYSGGSGIFYNDSTGIINKSGGGSTQLSNGSYITFNNYGSVSITSGNIQLNGNGFQSGTYSIAAGASLQGSINMSFWGDAINNNGSIALTGLRFRDSTTQQLSGTGTINSLTLDGSGGIQITGTQTINNSLTLNNGKIVLGSSDLIIGATASITNANSNSYIITSGWGGLKRPVNNNQTDVLFPVGTADSYLPATIQLTAASTSDNFTVRVMDHLFDSYDMNGNANGSAIPSNLVNRSWIVQEDVDGGSDATVTLQWNTSDESLNFDRTTCSFAHYSSNWIAAAPASANGSGPFTLSETGITSFSPFGVIGQFVTSSDLFSACSNSGFNISYSVVGTYNSGNVFTTELSDSTGSFSSPTIIGTDTSSISGIIENTLPGSVATHGNYKVRVVSSDPVSTGTESNILISPSYSVNENISICKGETHTFPDGDTASVPKIHFSTLTSMDGCDSVIETHLNVNEVDTSVTFSGNSIAANATASAYQWLDCNNGFAEITNANSQSFSGMNGTFAVMVSQYSCADTSSCYTILSVGISNGVKPEIELHPNPVRESLFIQTGQASSFQILNIYGQLIYEGDITGNSNKIDVSDFPPGIYLLRLIKNAEYSVAKWMKE